MTLLRNGAPIGASPSERATVRIVRNGIVLPDRPSWPQENLPEDITGLSDEDLIGLYVRASAWVGYLATMAASAMVDERAADTALEVAEARALIASWGGTSKDRVTIAKAERQADPGVTRMRRDQEDRYADRKLLEVLASNAERNTFLVSRELTRRTSGPAPEQRSRRFGS